MVYKFQKLEIYQLALEYIELKKYATSDELRPSRELGAKLFAKVQSMKKFLGQSQAKELQSIRRSSVVGRRS
jgi:hypothetical protein